MKYFLCLLLALVSPAFAATLNVPSSYASVQLALNAAQPGDTILLASGHYAETVETVASGTSLARITIDGQGVASLKRLNVGDPYYTVKGLTFSGMTGTGTGTAYKPDYFEHVNILRGAHFTRFENVTVDTESKPYIQGVEWANPREAPFGSGTLSALDAASNCVFDGVTILNIHGSTGITSYGDDNVFQNLQMRDFQAADCMRIFGRRHSIKDSVFDGNGESTIGAQNHRDWVQSFGDNYFGSRDHVFERCIVKNMEGTQLMQISSKHIHEVGWWTIKNCIFYNIGLQASQTVPGMKWLNNTFYRSNRVGNALSFGSRSFIITTDVPSGSLTPGQLYTVKNGSVTYNSVTYAADQTFLAVDGVLTYSETPAETLVYRNHTTYCNDSVVKNNVFLDCGNGATNKGWYSFRPTTPPLTGCVADYNYVGGADFSPKSAGTAMIGEEGFNEYKFYEANGINGGDPKFVDFSRLDFRLLVGSPLIDAGVAVEEVTADFTGAARPLVVTHDIGAYEYDDGNPPPDPPPAASPPTAPSGLTATATSDTTISLVWDDNANNEVYQEVERSPNGTTGWARIATLAADLESYASTGLTASTAYYYRVRAGNADGTSSYAATATATTEAAPVVNLPPAAPTSLGLIAIGQSAAALSWVDNSDDETHFEVARSLDGEAWVTLPALAANLQEWVNTGLEPSTTYYYRIRAVNAYGWSDWTGEVVTTTAATPPRTNRRPRNGGVVILPP